MWQAASTVLGYYRSPTGRAWMASPYRLVDAWTMMRGPQLDDFVLRSRSGAAV